MNHPIHGGNLAWAAKYAGCPASYLLDFSASINPFGPPEGVFCAIKAQFNNLIHYPDPDYQQLRRSLAQYHGLPEEWILPGNGSAELLTWAALDLSQLELVSLLVPTFADYRRSLHTFSVPIQPIPLGLTPTTAIEDLSLHQMSTHGQGLILNNPHNPTGRLWRRESLLSWLERFALVVVDEAFMDFLPEAEQQSLVNDIFRYPNLVILRSLTKFFRLPGLRLGYAIAHPDRLRKWQQWRDPWPVNTLAEVAAMVALQDKDFIHATRRWLPIVREQLIAGLQALPGLDPLPSAANFILVKTQGSSSQLQQQLLTRARILIRDCLSFPELGDRYFRVAVRTEVDNQRLLIALATALATAMSDETE